MTNEKNHLSDDDRNESHQTNDASPDEPSEALIQIVQQAIASESGDQLESLDPEAGVEQHLNHKQDIKDSTEETNRTKFGYFVEYCEINDIGNLNDLTSRHVVNFQSWRREESTDGGPLAPKTMRDDMYLFRGLLQFFEDINAVPTGISKAVQIPTVDDPGRDYTVEDDRVAEIIDHLRTYNYATIEHVLFSILAETGRRLGGIRALDLDDFHDDSEPYLEFRHHPGETPLKNDEASECQLSIGETVATVIEDYRDHNRHDVVDEYGRQPLLTTKHGRPAASTLRRLAYAWTRPCKIGNPCPHGRSPETCTATSNKDQASKCESARPPHAFRHGHLTELRREGLPIELIRDRCDVSQQTLEKHYDERTPEEKRRQRAATMAEAQTNGGGYL